MKRDVEILDCTIRDGNYAVNFKFTAPDTQVLTEQLTRLGFNWIEVGHGLGLGGTEAGKGQMVASDVALIQAAKRVSGDARVGVFFIPGIGTRDHMKAAREAGLDFIRIGYNATTIEEAFPFVEYARELGLVPCVNMMKTYGITPEEFGQQARRSAEAGAEVVYCVDSAGSMFPEDVRAYFSAARETTDCRLGFHGHNNLMMVIANSMEAYRHGVEFHDATLSGLGRSAGNAPSEILVAVFDRLGIQTGVDLFALMDAVDTYMWPLVSRIRPHDMLGVAGGYSQFHSSFLPKVAKAAGVHRAEIRRLVVAVAQHDPVDLDDEFLEEAATRLAGTAARVGEAKSLLSFQADHLSRQRISTSQQSVDELVDGLVAASAKKAGSRAALHLVPTKQSVEGSVSVDFVLSAEQVVMGRVLYGSTEALKQMVSACWPRIGVFIVSCEPGWSAGAARIVADLTDPDRVVPVRDRELRSLFLLETLDTLSLDVEADTCLVHGITDELAFALARFHAARSIYLSGVPPAQTPSDARYVHVSARQDWSGLNLQFPLVICAAPPSADDARILVRSVSPNGKLLSLQPDASGALAQELGARLVGFDFNGAYAGVLERHYAKTRALVKPVER